jgi:hypothetical protein
MSQSVSRCPDDETMAAWVEGRLSKAESDVLIEHASVCEECMPMIDAANETFHAEADREGTVAEGGWHRWLLAAAAVLAVALTSVIVLRARRHDPTQELVEVAPHSARAVEARLTGGFPWAPYRGAMRTDRGAVDTERLKVAGVAANAIERAEHDTSPEALRAAGVALVLIDRPEEAMARLTEEAKRSPSEARVWSDLSAAQYADAVAGRTSLYPEALASANRALQIDPRMGEALFNRALVLEHVGIRGEARVAWQRYLDVDRSSPWANEAREHLSRLAAEREIPRFETDRQRLEAAAASSEADTVRTLVDRHRERARAFGEAEYLGRWAEALTRGDAGEAARWLSISRNIGAALATISGESLLRDAVQVIDTADSQKRLRIAAAHITYRRGRIAFSRREQGQGERDLRLAAGQFAEAGDPMSLAARSYAAGARLAQNDVVTSRQELAALLTEVDARPGYLSQAGQVRWELARGLMFDDDSNGAARLLAEAESLFRRGGETENQAYVGSMLADTLTSVGQPDEAWLAKIRAFEALSAAGQIDLLDQALGGAVTTALRVGKPETARALVGVAESIERAMSNDSMLVETLVRKSVLDGPTDAAVAIRSAAEATSVALRVPDASLRARYLADADLAMAVALADSDPRRTRALASRALDVYAGNGLTNLLAEPYLVRARASLRIGDTSAAERDLSAGMLAVEQHPAGLAGAGIGTDVLDAGIALFQEAIRRDLDRGEVTSAYADAERMRGVPASSASVDELRRRLGGSGTAVVTIVVLPREVISLSVTERGVVASRHAIPREEVAALAARDDDASSAALYDLLIRPSAAALADAHALIVVPDRMLEQVPFSALRDRLTGRALIERMTVSIAPSATALRIAPRDVRPRTVAALGLPSGRASGMAALPAVELEVTEIGRLYPAVRGARTVEITARTVEENAVAADVLHIAGHTEGDPAGDDALAVADGPLSWRTIAAMHGMSPVVVLSACNTLRRPHDPDRRALSLAGAFAAAGAGDVVGTLAPIADRDAGALFLALHEQLARGIAAPAALRQVQLTQLRRPGVAWRHLAVLTTTIHRTE